MVLLVAAEHVGTAGHDVFTFEHLWSVFSRAVKRGNEGANVESMTGGSVKSVSKDILVVVG